MVRNLLEGGDMSIKRQYRDWLFYVIAFKTKNWNRETKVQLQKAIKYELIKRNGMAFKAETYFIALEKDYLEAKEFARDILTELARAVFLPKIPKDQGDYQISIRLQRVAEKLNNILLQYEANKPFIGFDKEKEAFVFYEVPIRSLKTLVALSLFYFIKQNGHLSLKICKECKQGFLPYEKRNIFCTNKCSEKYHNRKKREKQRSKELTSVFSSDIKRKEQFNRY